MKNKLDFLRGLLLSVGLTLCLVLLFALVIKWLGIGSSWVRAVNQIIKIIALWAGLWLFLRERGVLSGGVFGCVYMVVTTLIFAIMGGGFSFSLKVFLDLLFCVFAGVLGGVIPVNCKRAKN